MPYGWNSGYGRDAAGRRITYDLVGIEQLPGHRRSIAIRGGKGYNKVTADD